MTRQEKARARRLALYAVTLAFVVFLVFRVDWPRVQTAFFDPEILADLFPKIITQAARNTLIFTFFAFTGGLIVGLLLALMRLSSIGPYRWFAVAYIEFFRGVPAIITLIFVGYVLPIALDIRIPGTYGPGAVGLIIVAAAYMAETIRAGIEAVPVGQMEAARSLGMTRPRAMGTIVVPQAFRIMIPPLTNELVLLIKDTSLLFVLGTTAATEELTKFGRDAVSDTFNGTPLVAVALVYLAITLPLTLISSRLEGRARRSR
jgi:polar amino acid transport system permease protein